MENDALLLLREALGPNAAVRRSEDGEPGESAVIEMEGGGRIPVRFAPWSEDRHGREHGMRRIWILPRATEDLRDRLRGRGESFVDLRGAVHLSFPNLLVDRVGLARPRRRSVIHTPVDPFSDRSSLVVRMLLEGSRHARSWGVRELAEAVGVGPATVTRVVRELRRYGVVEARRAGRALEVRLTDARSLFSLWTGAYDWTKNPSLSLHAPVGDPFRFLPRLEGALGRHRWALALHAGASLVAPHATWERVHVYVGVAGTDGLLEIAEEQGWPVAEEGRLVLMKPYYRDSVWYNLRTARGLPVVSDLQLALDLWHYPLRGREQAEHVLDTTGLLA